MQNSTTAPGSSGPANSGIIRAPGPGDKVRKNWLATAQLSAALLGVQAGLQHISDEVAAQKLISRFLDHLHPFKIYQLPSVLRTTPDPTTDWLKFRIRAGRVMETDASGTDSDGDPTPDNDPDSEYYPLPATDIIIPIDTPLFWFWLEIGSTDGITTAQVRWGTDPTATSYGGTPPWTTTNPWLNFETPDASHIPIGVVDTETSSAAFTPIIRQYLRTDVIFTTGKECPYG